MLADLVVIVHLAFVAFVVAGALLVLRWPRLAWLHLPALAWGVFVELGARVCPLTPLENRLRAEAGGTPYETGFVEHYLVPVLYPANLTPTHQLGLGVALLAGNALLYAVIWRRRRARPPGDPT